MSTVEEIKAAIDKLSFDERAKLERLLHDWVDDEWDRRIIADAASGKLDRLLSRVDSEIDSDSLEDAP